MLKILFFVVCWLSQACLAVEAIAARLVVENASIRSMPPGQTVTAAYLTITNLNSIPCTLHAASSQIAERVEFHRHSHSNGMMQMRKVDSLVIPSGSQLVFRSGGLHLMLFGVDLAQEAKSSPIELVLDTLECGRVVTEAPLQALRRLPSAGAMQ